ncbi:jg18393 [Pararge aegeria aegeria]|uniref:Jg18393 protein n=1 Tax=Pararge aegeria aegeria TaxID=348720 RepID=A0A8S4QXG1_9NEOP|nr:jg18393 [Pararge aegeria aegeria]
MTRFIKKYVSSCMECAYGKGDYGKPSGELHPIAKPNLPMDTVHIDHLGPFSRTRKGYQYILMLNDAFSKFLIARPTKTVNSVETLEVLRDVLSLFGYPKRIVSDRNLAFTSRIFREFTQKHLIHHTLNAIACPRANGQVERCNRTLLDALRTRSLDPNMWTECLPDVIWGINNTVSESTGFHPYELIFTHKGRLLPNLEASVDDMPVTEKRKIASNRLRQRAVIMKRQYDKRHKPEKKFSKGDLVLWKQSATGGEAKCVNNKLRDLYSGPYIIKRVLDNGRYEIRSIKGMRGYKKFTGIVPADSLRPYRSAPNLSDSSSDEEIVTRDDLIDLLES